MRRKLVSIVLVTFIGIPLLGAEPLTVSYLQGSAVIKTGYLWSQLAIGESVAPDATVRLDGDAVVELSGTGANITLDQPGTYELRNLVSQSKAMGLAGVGEALVSTLRNLLAPPAANQSAVMGVRSENKGASTAPSWYSSSADVYLNGGKDYLTSGQYPKAIAQFQEGMKAADPSELPELRFYLAYAYSVSGDAVKALQETRGLIPDSSDAWAPDFLLLKAKLLLDTNAFKQDVAWLSGSASSLADDSRLAPTYYLVLGAAYRGLGDKAQARRSLANAARLGGDSDVGKAAERLSAAL